MKKHKKYRILTDGKYFKVQIRHRSIESLFFPVWLTLQEGFPRSDCVSGTYEGARFTAEDYLLKKEKEKGLWKVVEEEIEEIE